MWPCRVPTCWPDATFQSWMGPSYDPAAIVLPSLENTRLWISPAPPTNFVTSRRVARSQTRTVVSPLPVASRRPLGEMLAVLTCNVCPLKVPIASRVAIRHRVISFLGPPDRSDSPSGANRTQPLRNPALILARSSHSRTAQTTMSPRASITANRSPLGEYARAADLLGSRLLPNWTVTSRGTGISAKGSMLQICNCLDGERTAITLPTGAKAKSNPLIRCATLFLAKSQIVISLRPESSQARKRPSAE